MGYRWTNAAQADRRTKNGTRLLLFVLADRTDDATGVSYYGIESLMERTNLSKSALHGAVRELVDLKLLEVGYKQGRNGCNVYRLLLTVQNPDGADSGRCEASDGADSGRSEAPTVQNLDSTVQNLHSDRAESAPNTLDIHQENPQKEEDGKAGALPAPAKPGGEEVMDFCESVVEDLCQLYPRRQNPLEAKQAIREALKTLLPRFTSPERQGAAAVEATTAWLRERVSAFAASRQGQTAAGTPHAATWFRSAGYDGDLSSISAAAGTKAQGTLEECRVFAEELGMPASDGETFFWAKQGNGWRNGKNPVKDWRATFRNWQHEGWLASQKKAASQPRSIAPTVPSAVRPSADSQAILPGEAGGGGWGDESVVSEAELGQRLAVAFRLTERELAVCNQGGVRIRTAMNLGLDQQTLRWLERLWRIPNGEVRGGQKVYHATSLTAFLDAPDKDISRARAMFSSGSKAPTTAPMQRDVPLAAPEPTTEAKQGLFAGIKANVDAVPVPASRRRLASTLKA